MWRNNVVNVLSLIVSELVVATMRDLDKREALERAGWRNPQQIPGDPTAGCHL